MRRLTVILTAALVAAAASAQLQWEETAWNFGIIKASRGGGGNSFWLKSSADHHMYDHVTATVTAAAADLTTQGHTFEIVGLLYLHLRRHLL